MKRLLTAAALLLLTLPLGLHVLAQNRMTFPIASQDSGHIALGLALRKLTVSGTFMQTPAHPDDVPRTAQGREIHAPRYF